jgi:hypothetical protein
VGLGAFEENDGRGKDRPVVVSRDADELPALMLTSKDHHSDAADQARGGRYWIESAPAPGIGGNGPARCASTGYCGCRVDDVRREGAALDRAIFDQVAQAAKRIHGLTSHGTSPSAGTRRGVKPSLLTGPEGHPFHTFMARSPEGEFVSSLIFESSPGSANTACRMCSTRAGAFMVRTLSTLASARTARDLAPLASAQSEASALAALRAR